MALAIIDGGSTKADWQVKRKGRSHLSFTTTGFNPNYDSQEKIANLLKEGTNGLLSDSQHLVIHYYGAGCWDVARKSIVHRAMSTVFPHASIHIEHDLLAAARATCGDQPGIACILGTGSNSVLYDGKKEVDNVTNLGFLLGDEGSGSMIGKRLVQAYFYREMPPEFRPIIEKECPNGKSDILDKIYSGGVPAAYLASFAKKFYGHRQHPFVWGLIKKCFDEFLQRHVFKYENYRSLPVHFVGSVAYYFSDILKELLTGHGLQMGIVLKRPIEALFEYHVNSTEGIDDE